MKRPVTWGIVLTLLGVVWTMNMWSLAMLYVPSCNGHWDEQHWCHELGFRIQLSTFAPVPGLLLIGFGLAQRIRQRKLHATEC